MDNLTHTLVGAAMAHAGLKRRTALGTATLIIGANLPDIDALSYLAGPGAGLAFRRGWTHGIPAVIVLSFALTGGMVLYDRLVRQRPGRIPETPAVPRELLLLAFLAILTHPVLDTLNTYGVRWFMPFSGRWFYGDTLFIVDPWVILVLAAGVWFGSRVDRVRRYGRRPASPAQISLAVVAFYVTCMAGLGVVGRRVARAEIEQHTGDHVEALMVSPGPLNPFTREVVARGGRQYYTGRLDYLFHLQLSMEDRYPLFTGTEADDARRRLEATRAGRAFLDWARFPTLDPARTSSGDRVRVVDLRYARPGGPGGFGTIEIPRPAGAGAATGTGDVTPAAPRGLAPS
jgi:inner membrane protein